MSEFTEWVVAIDASGNSVPSTEQSPDRLTGWFEGYVITPSSEVNSNLAGVLSVVGGLEDEIDESIAIGNNPAAPVRDYKVKQETLPDGTTAGTSKFYLSGQYLKLVLSGGGATPVTDAARIRVSYVSSQ